MAHITTCADCGSARFSVQEIYWHDAEVHEDGVLFYDSFPGCGGRERIMCSDCEREFTDDDFVAVDYT